MSEDLLSPAPQLRVALWPTCNLRCSYCRVSGEGASSELSPLDLADLGFLIECAVAVGYRHVKITGGEPLLRPDCAEVVERVIHTPGLQDVQLVTNGTLLAAHASRLRSVGLQSLTLSLDAAQDEAYRRMRGGSISPVLAGLEAAKREGLDVRINAVVTKSNYDQIGPLISLAGRFGVSLKLLDLINLDAPERPVEWIEQFVPFVEVRRLLSDRGATLLGLEPAPGNTGAPLLDYEMPGGQHVVLKDSMFGTCYHATCRDCDNFPCQDALISLRVTHDGKLKKCLVRDDNLVDIRGALVNRDRVGVEVELKAIHAVIAGARYCAKAWPPRGAP